MNEVDLLGFCWCLDLGEHKREGVIGPHTPVQHVHDDVNLAGSPNCEHLCHVRGSDLDGLIHRPAHFLGFVGDIDSQYLCLVALFDARVWEFLLAHVRALLEGKAHSMLVEDLVEFFK